ncbi:MAG: glycosyltransferase family 2 protein [Thermotogae bacterium]|nr:glycosyltransferase family 2 protein [Thermotogota bacterium]
MKVAVIIPTYNRHEALRRAVESVLRQRYPHEVWIGDDGSTPPVRYDHPRVRVVRFPHTGNPSYVRNRLVEMADAPLVAFLDDDDEYVDGRLALQAHHLMDGNYDASVCNVLVIDHRSGEPIGLAYADSPRPLLRRLLFPFGGYGFIPQVGALMVRRDTFLKLGGFNERLTLLEDWEFSLRLFLNYKVGFYNFAGVVHYQNRPDGLRLRQSPDAPLHYERLLEVVGEYLPPSLHRKVKRHFYGALSRRLLRSGDRKGALKYALKSLRHGPEPIALKSLLQLPFRSPSRRI